MCVECNDCNTLNQNIWLVIEICLIHFGWSNTTTWAAETRSLKPLKYGDDREYIPHFDDP